jgi:hypothetical protein
VSPGIHDIISGSPDEETGMEPSPQKVEKGSVRFSEREVAEVDDRGHPVLRIPRDRIQALHLRWGLQAARPAVQLGLGVLLTAAGAVLLVALLVGWARQGGVLHLEMVGGFAFLVLAGGWLLTTALRQGYYLEVLTLKGREKVRFDRRVAPEEIIPFLAEAGRRLGYTVEDAQDLPESRR